MASSFQALIAVTGMDGLSLAHWSSTFLGLTTYLCGLAVVYLFGGIGAIRQSLPAIIIIGTVMAGTQYLLSVTGLWTLAGFVAGMAGILASILVTRMPVYRNSGADDSGAAGPASRMGFATALSSYIFLIIIVTPSELYAPLHSWLNQVKLSLQFPEIITAYGWKVAAGSGKKISIFGHPGALLSYTAFISYIFYATKGYYNAGSMKRIWTKTLKSGVSTSIGIISMVCFAMIMDQSGMTYLLAEGVSRLFGPVYPLLSSAIGTLGAFMTGSNTNSNVIFGMFQKQTAELAGLSVAVILGAQTTGGSIGSMLAPAKILVGCSTVGLAGREGPVLGITIKYGVIITAIIGLVALIVHLL
jgi:lactate permease